MLDPARGPRQGPHEKCIASLAHDLGEGRVEWCRGLGLMGTSFGPAAAAAAGRLSTRLDTCAGFSGSNKTPRVRVCGTTSFSSSTCLAVISGPRRASPERTGSPTRTITNRDGRRGPLGRQGCRRADGHDSAHLEVDQLYGQRRKPLALAFVKSVLESDVSAFDPPVRPKPLDHRPNQGVEARGTGPSDRDQAQETCAVARGIRLKLAISSSSSRSS